jgi:hypothetical protein
MSQLLLPQGPSPRGLLVPEAKSLELPDVLRGYAQGYNEFADVITQTADGADLNRMWREFQAATALLNRQRDPFVDLLTFDVTDPTERVLLPVSEDFEEATEFGEPRGIRIGVPFVAGYDFKWYDLAIRYTWLFLAESDSAQVRALNSEALEADNRLVWTRVMRTIFNNVNSSALVNQQNVNVYRFYNADGTVPPSYKGTTFSGTHTHYVTSGAATVDSGDMTAIEDHLYHHGYRLTLGYKLVLMVNRQEGAVIRGFVKGAGSPVATYDFIPGPNVGGGWFLPANRGVIGAPDGNVAGFAPGTIGSYGPFLIVEDDYIPAGYMFAFATAGERNVGNPVGIRQHARSELRGLKLAKGPTPDYPLVDSFYQHGLGTGVRHRGAGVVMQVTASGTYTIPPAYV